MSLSDPIGDMIARVKNAQARNHKKVELPSSNFKSKIADILKNEGFIKDFKVSSDEKKPTLSLELKYHSGNPVISAFERVSKPGRRIFSSADSLPKINNGLGIAIVSTPYFEAMRSVRPRSQPCPGGTKTFVGRPTSSNIFWLNEKCL